MVTALAPTGGMALIAAVVTAIRKFAGAAPQADDLTLMALVYHGPDEAEPGDQYPTAPGSQVSYPPTRLHHRRGWNARGARSKRGRHARNRRSRRDARGRLQATSPGHEGVDRRQGHPRHQRVAQRFEPKPAHRALEFKTDPALPVRLGREGPADQQVLEVRIRRRDVDGTWGGQFRVRAPAIDQQTQSQHLLGFVSADATPNDRRRCINGTNSG